MSRLIEKNATSETGDVPSIDLTAILRARLADAVPKQGSDLTPDGASFARRTVDALLYMAIDGDVDAIRLIFELADGRAPKAREFAVGTIGLPYAMARSIEPQRPYCMVCHRWGEPHEHAAALGPVDPHD